MKTVKVKSTSETLVAAKDNWQSLKSNKKAMRAKRKSSRGKQWQLYA